MTNKNQALAEIQKIIERFQKLPEAERSKYNEAQIRHSFILPLFRALGWDIENPAEMTAEELVSGGFADFGFYLNSVPVFYVETKRPREDLNSHIKQAINYAWLKGITWAVLTNFEEMKVFNADVKSTNPLNDIFLNLRWNQYSQQDFDLLWLLSKESFLQGQINEQAVRYGRMAQKEPVNQLLFAQLTAWRRDLFKNMRAYGNIFKEDSQKLDEAVQRFLDRLIFIRTVEDRQLEQPRLIQLYRQYEKSRKKGKNLFHDLRDLFKEMDEIYNARLFAQHQLDLLDMHDDMLLGKIIEGLYNDPRGYGKYDFSAISADILGNIYEQYLSFKMLDPEGKQAVSDKHTKRKSQGIYYTPQFVVRYIVNQTLGKLLESGKVDPYKIRVLDPACGSGSFLIEAFDVLDRFLMKHGTPDHQQHHRKRRLHILRHNIYGVDLDPQAVEVAQLNLLLRAAIERGKLDTLEHIKVGNSLIDDAEVAGETAFNWQKEFPEVFADGGFDVIIGNPPYGAKLPIKDSEYLKQQYQTFAATKDVYTCFMELSLKISQKGALFSFIVPSAWLGGPSYNKLRKILLEKQVETIISLPFDVFPDAYIDTLIFSIKNQSAEANHEVATHVYPKKLQLNAINLMDNEYMKVMQNSWIQGENQKFVLDAHAMTLIDKLRLEHKCTLGDFVKIKRGVLFDSGLLTKEKSSEKSHPYFEGDIYRYETNEKLERWIEYGDKMKEYPKEFDWFENPRVLLRRLVNRQQRLMASFAEKTYITNKNLYVVKPKRNEISNFYILGLLNSSLMSYLYLKQVSQATKDDFPQVTIRDTANLPAPEIDKAKHDELVQLVESMLQLKKDYAAADVLKEDRRHDIAAKISHTDAEIDKLVYGLYGLTEAEIAVVEGR